MEKVNLCDFLQIAIKKSPAVLKEKLCDFVGLHEKSRHAVPRGKLTKEILGGERFHESASKPRRVKSGVVF